MELIGYKNDSSDESCDSDSPLVNLVKHKLNKTDEAESSTSSEDVPLITIKKNAM